MSVYFPLKHKYFQSNTIITNGETNFICLYKILFLAVFQLTVLSSCAQYYEEKPEPEFGIGIKILKGEILYGPKSFYITDPKSISLQALVRRDFPLKISSNSPYQHRYINFAIESGFLFGKANVFDSSYRDPNTNTITHEHSRNPTYLPVYLGLYNRSAFAIGAEMFYWKSLGKGVRDIWGVKFLSLGYNARSFRITISGEWSAQTKNIKNTATFFSVDFLWKLVIDD
ncbi:MAG: hypothetical protein ABI402_11405 [Ferruginibacter sp.]